MEDDIGHIDYSLVSTLIDFAQVDNLLKKVTKKEIYLALISMHPDKMPGLDRFPPFFFHYWNLISYRLFFYLGLFLTLFFFLNLGLILT